MVGLDCRQAADSACSTNCARPGAHRPRLRTTPACASPVALVHDQSEQALMCASPPVLALRDAKPAAYPHGCRCLHRRCALPLAAAEGGRDPIVPGSLIKPGRGSIAWYVVSKAELAIRLSPVR